MSLKAAALGQKAPATLFNATVCAQAANLYFYSLLIILICDVVSSLLMWA
jgi:hypothetical protein